MTTTAAVLVLIACRASAPQSPTPDPASVAPAAVTPLMVRTGDAVRPSAGVAALKAWTPDRPAVETGGECSRINMPADGVRMLLVQFPSRAAVVGSLNLTLDASDRLIRYSDTRGVLRTPGYPQAKSDAERDSIMTAARAAARRTTISLDFVTGMGLAINVDGGLPTNAASGRIAVFDSVPALGEPTRRIAQARAICARAGIK